MGKRHRYHAPCPSARIRPRADSTLAPRLNRSDPKTVTQLLQRVRIGDTEAASSLLPLVYDELRSLALAVFSGERLGHTLQPTALIHESWMKLAGGLGGVHDRKHFFAIAARAMGQVLTDHARTQQRQKRGGSRNRVTLDEQLMTGHVEGPDLFDLEDSMQRLAALNQRHARVVELRIFGGLTVPETAEILQVSTATVERDWFVARAWLRRELAL